MLAVKYTQKFFDFLPWSKKVKYFSHPCSPPVLRKRGLNHTTENQGLHLSLGFLMEAMFALVKAES